ncbi:response regulator [Alkalimonas amylolytica]|uniref:Two-component system, chemotaxis family, response regulator CheY n=1 Tax=Alkalimonas amylolytica TaxID=152573 RepID=A0A1H4CMD0_ALKAM|nr:response regulator [Alkalimonas amylolytica]SEA61606.1 two-component system, chemotaxis family, response regulator CheY [Alkalimonas amylolytica]
MKNALIIDDNAVIREVLRQILMTMDFTRIIDAPNGRLGLQHAIYDQVDVVFLDLELPDIHGISLLSQLKEACTAPVVVITSHSTRENLQQAIQAGAAGFITKPFFGQKIADVLQKLRKRTTNVA